MQMEQVDRTTRRMKKTHQAGTRDRTNMWWMKTKRWRGRVCVWVKKPKGRVQPNIERMRGIKSDRGVNWATVSPTKRPAHHGTRRI